MKRIRLNGKHGKGQYALIDNHDFVRVFVYNWHLRKDGKNRVVIRYYKTIKNGITKNHRQTLHSLIMDNDAAQYLHIDDNPLNCQKKNLVKLRLKNAK